jgi:hypothetical protein
MLLLAEEKWENTKQSKHTKMSQSRRSKKQKLSLKKDDSVS